MLEKVPIEHVVGLVDYILAEMTKVDAVSNK